MEMKQQHITLGTARMRFPSNGNRAVECLPIGPPARGYIIHTEGEQKPIY
jgi:hypothetical protein